MDQQIYDNMKKSEFEKIELLFPICCGGIGGFIMLMIYLYTHSMMIFNVVLFMLVVVIGYKAVSFLLTLWEYSDGNDIP